MKRAMETPQDKAAQPVAGVGAGAGCRPDHGHDDAQSLASDNFLSLPAWFPAEKACAILRATGKRFVLIADGNGLGRIADRQQLASAPLSKSVSWCGVPLGPSVTPAATPDEVLGLMDAHRMAYLPVVVGGVVVGIVARDAATAWSARPDPGRLARIAA
jgi:hypothetical protein